MIELKESYKEANMRALYIVAMRSYGSLNKLCKDVGMHSQYVTQCRYKGIADFYAGYLGRHCGFHPAVLCYEPIIQLSRKVPFTYEELIDKQNYFTKIEKKYILSGSYIKDPVTWLKNKDASLKECRCSI